MYDIRTVNLQPQARTLSYTPPHLAGSVRRCDGHQIHCCNAIALALPRTTPRPLDVPQYEEAGGLLDNRWDGGCMGQGAWLTPRGSVA